MLTRMTDEDRRIALAVFRAVRSRLHRETGVSGLSVAFVPTGGEAGGGPRLETMLEL